VTAPTLGVEEEYLLVDPTGGRPVAASEAVRGRSGTPLQAELLQAQVEAVTPVCSSLDELAGHLRLLRTSAAAAAADADCGIIASGTAPVAPSAPPPVTRTTRYRQIQADAPQLVEEQLINGMHVHVGVPDRATAVGVLNHLRPWLPTLVALGANSPVWQGHDTGFDSWRTIVSGRWPTTGIPPSFSDDLDYDTRIDALCRNQVIRDRAQIYWLARPSERWPTIEVRAPDIQPTVDDAVALAGIIRALVATLLQAHQDKIPAPEPPPERLSGALWRSARHGLGGSLDDVTGRLRPARTVLDDLLTAIAPALAASGDERRVRDYTGRLLHHGTPAQRQRRVLQTGGTTALTAALLQEFAAGRPDQSPAVTA
jgi:carboxylate-amine ligase